MRVQAGRVFTFALALMCCAQFLSAQPKLTVNKSVFNDHTLTDADPEDLTGLTPFAGAIGSPVLYVVVITNSGVAGPDTLTEVPPIGFVPTGITCTQWAGATGCWPGSMTTFPPLTFFFSADTPGPPPEIVLQIRGYFQIIVTGSGASATISPSSDGLKTNLIAINPLLCPGPTDCGQANLNIPGVALGVDLAVSKTASVKTTTLGSTVQYSITLTNNGPGGVYLGGNVQLSDTFTNDSTFPVLVTLSGFTCPTAFTCPSPPPAALNYDGATTTFTIPSNGTGYLAATQSLTVTFTAVFTSTATCFPLAGDVGNGVVLQYSNTTMTISDTNNANNTSRVDVALNTSGLKQCPISTPVVILKTQVTPTPIGGFLWVTSIEYMITITNPDLVNAATNVPVTDYLVKTVWTPAFVATVTPGPTCNGCSFTGTSTNNSPLPVNQSNTYKLLFQVTIDSIPANGSVNITYFVTYTAPCETDAPPVQTPPITTDPITDYAYTNVGGSSVTTNMARLPFCQLSVIKMLQPSSPTQLTFSPSFNTVVFSITYSNLSSATLNVGTLRDDLSLSSSTYGPLPVTYTASCTTTAGTVTPSSVPPVPTAATVQFQTPSWAGITAINGSFIFGPNSTLTCTVSVTATATPDPGVYCQGAGTPTLINSAFMDLDVNVQPTFYTQPPQFFASATAGLPLCRKVEVNKSPIPSSNASGGPSRTVEFQITVQNEGADPVSGFMLTDQILPPLIPLATPAPICTGSAACTPIPPGNPVQEVFGTIPKGDTATITLYVMAPANTGSFPNIATGSFAPGGNFYFGGNPAVALQGLANVQVVAGASNGYLEICKASSTANPVTGNFTFTATIGTFTSGALVVPVGACTAPISVPVGTVTVTEAPTPGAGVTSITANQPLTSDLTKQTAMVTVVAGDVSTATVVTFTNSTVPMGFVEVCKDADPGTSVTVSFPFNIPGAPDNPYVIPVGACSGPIPVQSGSVTVTELAQDGYQLVGVSTIPPDRLVSMNIPGGSAIVTVVPGDVSTETVVEFTNGPSPGQLKTCKVAGTGIMPGQTFNISANGVSYPPVPAGPAAQGGYCVLDSTFPVGTVVTVNEAIAPGAPYQVSSIAVNPPDRIIGTPNLGNGTAQVTIGTGFTEVTFTNTATTVQSNGQLNICNIAGVGVAVGTMVTFTATVSSPNPPRNQTYFVPAGPPSQGGFCISDDTFPVGTPVTVMEVTPTGTVVTGITVAPAGQGGTPDLLHDSVVVTVGTGLTEVAFTNTAFLTVTTSVILNRNRRTGARYQRLAATGGTPPYFWQLTDGALPPGLLLNPLTGEISGMPMAGLATTSVTFTVTDSSSPSQTASASFTDSEALAPKLRVDAVSIREK